MATATKLLTAEDLHRLPSDLRCELIDGVLIELSPPGNPHARIAAKATLVLFRAEATGLGMVLGEGGYVLRRGPDTVRAPDAAFILKDHLPAGGIPAGFWDGAPDIVVEVASPWDTPTEIQTKIREWVEAGARLVLELYPEKRTVDAVRSLQQRETLTEEDTLDFGEVLPGFSCRVAEFFD